jgi:hypothetical protein
MVACRADDGSLRSDAAVDRRVVRVTEGNERLLRPRRAI